MALSTSCINDRAATALPAKMTSSALQALKTKPMPPFTFQACAIDDVANGKKSAHAYEAEQRHDGHPAYRNIITSNDDDLRKEKKRPHLNARILGGASIQGLTHHGNEARSYGYRSRSAYWHIMRDLWGDLQPHRLRAQQDPCGRHPNLGIGLLTYMLHAERELSGRHSGLKKSLVHKRPRAQQGAWQRNLDSQSSLVHNRPLTIQAPHARHWERPRPLQITRYARTIRGHLDFWSGKAPEAWVMQLEPSKGCKHASFPYSLTINQHISPAARGCTRPDSEQLADM
eukprot:1147895-Pelagomonas_calceolata.AAC.1